MQTKNRFITGAAILFAITIPIVSLAATGNLPNMMRWFSWGWERGIQMLQNTEVRTLLESKGIKLPTVEQETAFQDTMKKSQEAMKNLSEADREAIEKAKRDAMRAKGIPLPSEADLTAHKALMTQIQTAMKNLTADEKTKLGFDKKHGGRKGRIMMGRGDFEWRWMMNGRGKGFYWTWSTSTGSNTVTGVTR